jgi:hypothetical protein
MRKFWRNIENSLESYFFWATVSIMLWLMFERLPWPATFAERFYF